MNKSIVLLAAAAFLCAGCERFTNTAAVRLKRAAAQEAAGKAQAKFTARLEARVVAARLEAAARAEAAAKAAAKAADKDNSAGAALAAMLCSSRKLTEEIESSMDVLVALSGEGGDSSELKRQFLESRRHYTKLLKKELPAHGATFEQFARYAADPLTEEQKQEFRKLVKEKCPRGRKALAEKTAGGLMSYFTSAAPN